MEQEQTIPIIDFSGKVLGYIKKYSKLKKEIALTFDRKVLGYYYYDRNETTDFNGIILGKGNLLVGLIYGNIQKK